MRINLNRRRFKFILPWRLIQAGLTGLTCGLIWAKIKTISMKFARLVRRFWNYPKAAKRGKNRSVNGRGQNLAPWFYR